MGMGRTLSFLTGGQDEEDRVLQLLPAPLRDLVGQVISDRYRVDEVVGVGGMGAVFRGHHLLMRRDIAIKVALPSLSAEERGRFRREAEIGGRLDHPNCVRIYEFNTSAAGLQYMVMPFIEGRPLTHYLTDKIPSEQAAAWAIDLLRGLGHAHREGIIHRDVKPENIIVGRDEDGVERLKLVDFGLAKLKRPDENLAATSNATMTGLMAGTPAYMAPEQALALVCDERSDLYSVGMVLYRMVLGELPYSNDDAYGQLRSRMTEELPPLPSFVPAPLARVIERLLRGKKERRYSSAGDVIECLEAFLAGQPLPHSVSEAVAPPPMAGTSSRLPVRESSGSLGVSGSFERVEVKPDATEEEVEPAKRRVAVIVGVAVALLLGGITLAVLFSSDEPAAESPSPTAAAPSPNDEPRGGATNALGQADLGHDGVEDRLARLIDVDRLTDAEREAASRLAFPSHDDDPCRAFTAGVDFVDKSQSPVLLALLPRVGTPEDCEGVGVRVAEILARQDKQGDDDGKRPVVVRKDRPATKRNKPRGSPRKPRAATPAADTHPAAEQPASPPAKPHGATPAAPRLDDGLKRPNSIDR